MKNFNGSPWAVCCLPFSTVSGSNPDNFENFSYRESH